MDDTLLFIVCFLAGAFFAAVVVFDFWSRQDEQAIEKGFIIMQGDKYRLEHVD